MEFTDPLSKRYYSIGEVCDLLKVAPSLIRHWESVFGKLHTRRDGKGGRLFTPDDISHLTDIHRLVKDDRMTLEGAKVALTKQNAGNLDVINQLESIKTGLAGLRSQIDNMLKHAK